MERDVKAVKARAGAKPAAAKRPLSATTGEVRSTEQRLADALAQQAATSNILRVMAESPSDVQPVLDAVAEHAAHLCRASFARVLLADGDVLRPLSHFSADGEAAIPAYTVPLKRTSIGGLAVLDRKAIHHADIVPLLDTEFPDARANASKSGFRAVLAVPLIHNDAANGAIFLWRREPGLFSPDQVALVETFATQAAIAIETVRLSDEAETRARELAESLKQQTATNEVLKAISRSTFDLGTVLHTLVESAARLCDADKGTITRQRDGRFYRAESYGFSREFMDYVKDVPIAPEPGSVTGRVLLEGRVIHIADVRDDPDYTFVEAQRLGEFRSIVGVPMMREGVPIGVLALTRSDVRPFTDRQIELISSFADQAVIAIENVRLFSELDGRNHDLTVALEQQTATSEILRVIASSPTDTQPVFDLLAQRAGTLCDAEVAVISRFDGGDVIELAAIQGIVPDGITIVRSLYPMRVDAETFTARAIRGAKVVHLADVHADPTYSVKDFAVAAHYRSGLCVPVIHERKVLGSMFVGRERTGLFTDSQVALLKTFADQAAIAIENVRLFKELEARNADLTEALEQQTATSEILRVISSSPTDIQPVFAAIVRSAVRLCGADHSIAARFDGEFLHPLAHYGFSPEALQIVERTFPMLPGPENMLGRVAQKREVVNLPDMLADSTYSREFAMAGGWRSGLGVPLVRDGVFIGAITVSRTEPGAFPDHLVTLLQTFAEQAVIAIENVRLFSELQDRNRDLTEALEQQTATSEILRVISSSQTDAQPVFETIVRSVRSLCGATFSGVYLLEGETFSLAAAEGLTPDELAAFAAGYPRNIGPDTVSGRAAMECRVVQTADLISDPEYSAAPGSRIGARTVLGVPLMRGNRAIGSIGVWHAEVKPFSETQIALLETFADQAVIAIENVRLFRELQERTRDLSRSVGELKALGDVGQAVSSTLDLETVLSTIVSRANQLSGMDGCAIYEYDQGRGEFYLHTADGLPDELVTALRASPIQQGEGALGALAVTGEATQVRDIVDERVYQSRVRKILIKHGYRSLLAVPLLREDHLLGGLVVNRRSAGEFASEVIDLLKTFATQSALAIQNARLFREIEAKSRQLEIASQHKSEFLANMSHELRTPLNAIIGFSEVLTERLFGDMNDKQAEYASDITESGRHLLTLINDILDLSKIEAGRMELDPSEFVLATAIDNTLTLVRERAERRGIALRCVIDPSLATIVADERKMKQVLLNLLSNALKFTPEGGKIEVVARAVDEGVEIAVTDTGVGIAPEELEAVFEEFRQVGSASRKAEGTGLGLAISRKFIELHGGRIWVTSKVGAGSTFAFTLPGR
jgi:GAF domain-containing protein